MQFLSSIDHLGCSFNQQTGGTLMSKTISRFVVALSLTALLATPALAVPSRDTDPGQERSAIMRIVTRLLNRLAHLIPTDSGPIGPFPAPSSNP
jgi:hypothetical protein